MNCSEVTTTPCRAAIRLRKWHWRLPEATKGCFRSPPFQQQVGTARGRAHPLYPGGAYDSGVWQRLHTLREAIREAAALPPHPALDAEFTSPGEPPCAS